MVLLYLTYLILFAFCDSLIYIEFNALVRWTNIYAYLDLFTEFFDLGLPDARAEAICECLTLLFPFSSSLLWETENPEVDNIFADDGLFLEELFEPECLAKSSYEKLADTDGRELTLFFL